MARSCGARRSRPRTASSTAASCYFYQSGRRVDVPKAVRPGIALHALAIRASIESGLREYDFLAGASRYKRELALATRPLVTLRAVGTGRCARGRWRRCASLAERAIARVRAVRTRLRADRDAAPTEPSRPE